MNNKLQRIIFLVIIGIVAFSIIGLLQLLQSMGIMLGWDTTVLFLPFKWILFAGLAWIFWSIAKGKVI